MKREQVLGPLREIAFALGVAMTTFGVASQETVELISGVVLSLITLVFAIRANDGPEVVMTLFRKVLSGAAGGLVASGTMDPERAEAMAGLALVLISSAWSFRSKGGSSGPGASPLWVIGALMLFALPGCTVAFDPMTGRFGVATDPAAVTAVVDRINERINQKIAEEVPPIVILPEK